MIVGLSGYARSGKDEAAKALVSHGYRRVAFADALRNILYVTNPLIPRQDFHVVERLRSIVDNLGWDDAKDTYPEIRRLLQVLGTEGGREIMGENIWVETAFKDVSPGDDVVLTDVRFMNEGDYIKSLGGAVIKVVREGFGPVNAHISDNAMESYEFDYTINNNGTVQDLHDEVLSIVGVTKETA